MLRANHAVRLGLRAASRNPELAFVKALLDQMGSLVAALPVLLAGLLVGALLQRGGLASLARAYRAVVAVRWPVAGGVLSAVLLSLVAGLLFWSGALPLLAADAEMDRRPPSGNFALLASRGFGRVFLAGLCAWGLSLVFVLACGAALLASVPALVSRPVPSLLAGAALVATVALGGSVLIDLLGRLMLVRAAALGDGASSAFGKAASLLSARLGACLAVTLAFLLLELMAASVAGMLTGVISSTSFLDADAELLALAPRIAVGLAAAAVFAWLEVARMGALAAIAADAEGLIETRPDPPPVPTTLARPEPVIEALPAEPVIEALPADDEEE